MLVPPEQSGLGGPRGSGGPSAPELLAGSLRPGSPAPPGPLGSLSKSRNKQQAINEIHVQSVIYYIND